MFAPRPGGSSRSESTPTPLTADPRARPRCVPRQRGRPRSEQPGQRRQQRVPGGGGPPPPAATGSEQALVQKAGQSAGSGIDPNIRSRVNQDTKTLNDNDKSFVDSLIFWQDSPPPGTIIDPTKEQQRLRDAQAAGQPATGSPPTITRRKRGLLEGVF